ncbi:hypothetical protein [Saccharomonospora sp. NB11]|uniref:hypothetical protein n=1 Tax=Saccharomonospora sp. NB11 TaxID=1642298 RepID=UPI0018D1DDF7|nr:hypothetical protein [Saccharomonospora sp. NB11]
MGIVLGHHLLLARVLRADALRPRLSARRRDGSRMGPGRRGRSVRPRLATVLLLRLRRPTGRILRGPFRSSLGLFGRAPLRLLSALLRVFDPAPLRVVSALPRLLGPTPLRLLSALLQVRMLRLPRLPGVLRRL